MSGAPLGAYLDQFIFRELMVRVFAAHGLFS